MTYSEKLKDPRWQKKRLEILERDEFTCQSCGDEENQLHVHHLYYQFDFNPWEYENDNYITLCAKCHEEITEYVNIMVAIVRGFGTCVDRALEASNLIMELDGYSIYELSALRKILEKKRKKK